MLENSVLNEKIIKELLKNYYQIEAKKVNRINRGSANIYNIDNKYILKEFTSDRDVSLIEKEYEVIKLLTKKGFRVPTYVETIEKKPYIAYEGKNIILQVYLDGYTMENNTGDYSKVIESATILGKLTKALEEYPLDEEYKDYPTKEKMEKGITKLEALKEKITMDNPYRDRILKDLDKKIEITKHFLSYPFENLTKVTLMTCHGDYSVQQLIYDDKNETAIIDFETVKKMPIVWEIIRSYTYVDLECKDGRMKLDTFKEYVKEVQKYISLSEYDLEYMPYIYLFQLVTSTFGYKEYNADNSKQSLLDFAFFRTSLCNYLYENMDQISKELLSLQ